MVYSFTILNSRGEQKQFYMTAEDDSSFYRRVTSMYCTTKDKITILEKIKDEDVESGKYRKEKEANKPSAKEQKLIDKSIELFKSAKKRCGQDKIDYINKYNFIEVSINEANDIIELLTKYKKIKIYWETTEKRGEHKFYALCK